MDHTLSSKVLKCRHTEIGAREKLGTNSLGECEGNRYRCSEARVMDIQKHVIHRMEREKHEYDVPRFDITKEYRHLLHSPCDSAVVYRAEKDAFYISAPRPKRLSNLEVTNHTRLFENGTCQVHLACIVENPNYTVSVRWQVSGNISLGEPNLTISWDPKNSSDQSYTCRAENAVSNLSVSVSAQSLCKGILTDLHRNKEWIIIISVIILCFVFVGIIYAWKKKRGSFPLASQHQGSSRDTDTPRSPGNTVYAQVIHPMQEMEIPKPIKNDSITIYSIVNHSREPTFPRLNTVKDIM
nr:SLAM family member 6 [Meriones unguiculatus]